jgi:flagellar motor switch protein FliG
MNLNDFRSNAYKNAAARSDDTEAPRPFTDVNREMTDLFAQSKKLSQQEAMQNPGKKTGKTADVLKAGGLLKVPVAQQGSGGRDSVYRRVAKFLLLIGVDEAAKILPHLTQEQTERIIPEIASIRSVSPSEASAILEEFQGLIQQARESGGIDTAREILEKAYGTTKAEQLLGKAVPYPDGKPFDYLNEADGERVFLLLKDESDAVRALVLSRIDPKKSAEVIDLMDSEDKRKVIFRLAKMQPVSPEVIRRVDHAMHEKSLIQTTEKAEVIDGRSALAEILRKMPERSEDEILGALSEDDPDLGKDLRSRLFTIEDVEHADDRFIQEQLCTMSDDDIAFLIAGKPDLFRSKILHNISTGRGDMILEEEQLHRPMLRKDCERITSQFFSVLRRAYEQGKLVVKGRDEDEYVK